jgi:hypothetical protein
LKQTNLWNCCQYCGCCCCSFDECWCYHDIEESNKHPSPTNSPVSIGSWCIQGNIQSYFNVISIRWNQMAKSVYVPWLGEGLLFNAKWEHLQWHHGENKILINEISMFVLYHTSSLWWIFMVLAYWNIITRVDMSL